MRVTGQQLQFAVLISKNRLWHQWLQLVVTYLVWSQKSLVQQLWLVGVEMMPKPQLLWEYWLRAYIKASISIKLLAYFQYVNSSVLVRMWLVLCWETELLCGNLCVQCNLFIFFRVLLQQWVPVKLIELFYNEGMSVLLCAGVVIAEENQHQQFHTLFSDNLGIPIKRKPTSTQSFHCCWSH